MSMFIWDLCIPIKSYIWLQKDIQTILYVVYSVLDQVTL